MKMVDWSEVKIAAKSTDEVRVLRLNAVRLCQDEVVKLCDAELARRKPVSPRPARESDQRVKLPNSVVGGFHFVCARERGVAQNPDGTFWTGTWVVAKMHAELAPRINAYVALHSSKAEPSYLQGTVLGWRVGQRDRQYSQDTLAKTEMGVEFLIAPTATAYEWRGDGSGEKGYHWIPLTKVVT